MRVPELKVLARDHGLRNYSRMRKAELVALLQNNPPPSRSDPPCTRSPPPPPQRHAVYVTLKLDDNRCCRIHSVSDDGPSGPRAPQGPHGNRWIVTDDRYVVMPWKVVTMHGKNMTLAEAVDGIFSHQESEAKECERREREREEIESKHKEYYETHMKEDTERLNSLVNWYEFKLNEIREAPEDSRPTKLGKLYRISERNKHLEVTITSAGVLNPVSYPVYPPELKLLEYVSPNDEENPFCDVLMPRSSAARCKTYDQLDYFRQIIRAYRGRDKDAAKYVKKVKAIIDKPLHNLELKHVRLAMAKVKCPRKLDISVFYQLTRRLPHEDLNYDDERLLIHFYDTFCNEGIKLLGKMVRSRTNVLYHLLEKVGKEPNADLFQFMKGPSHQRTEEEIKLVFKNLG